MQRASTLTERETELFREGVLSNREQELAIAITEVKTWMDSFIARDRCENYSMTFAALFELLMMGKIVLRVINGEVRIFPVKSA
ncbi:MAG: hypothetical protein ABW318_23140 [Vicinamibacterales bacterium]